MKKVTISNSALDVINMAGKEAASIAHIHASDDDGVEFSSLQYPYISDDDMDFVLWAAEPCSDWKTTFRDAARHARNAYRKSALRHNQRVLNVATYEWRDTVQELARARRERRRNRRDYSEKLYHHTTEAARKHELFVNTVKAEIRKLDPYMVPAGNSSKYSWISDHVAQSIRSAYTAMGLWWTEGSIAVHPQDYKEFLDTAEDEYRKALDKQREREQQMNKFPTREYDSLVDMLEDIYKNALAGESESAAK